MVLDQVDQIQIVKLVTLGGCHSLKKCICMLYRPFFHNVNLWENVSWVQCASRDGAESYNSKVCPPYQISLKAPAHTALLCVTSVSREQRFVLQQSSDTFVLALTIRHSSQMEFEVVVVSFCNLLTNEKPNHFFPGK